MSNLLYDFLIASLQIRTNNLIDTKPIVYLCKGSIYWKIQNSCTVSIMNDHDKGPV